MTSKAHAFCFNHPEANLETTTQLHLNHDRQLHVQPNDGEEIIEITEKNGDIILKILMTEKGPVISLSGAQLQLEATKSIALKAKEISIEATEKTSLKSQGTFEVEASSDIDILSKDNIRAKGKMIFLN